MGRLQRWFGLGLVPLLGLLLGACLAAGSATPTPGPLAPVHRWGETVARYRYERTTIVYAPNAAPLVLQETGEVIRPDRQRVQVRSRADSREEVNEVLIVGQRAWTRPVALNRPWQPTAPGQLPAEPLALALETLAAASPLRSLGERPDPPPRLCQGFDFTFAPAEVRSWPALLSGDASPTATAALWHAADGTLCSQTVRLEREGRLIAEFTLQLKDINTPLTIEPPAN